MTFFKTDKDKGLQADAFSDALDRADAIRTDPEAAGFVNIEDYLAFKAEQRAIADSLDDKSKTWPEQPGSDGVDPYGHVVKPKGVKYWSTVPSTDAEKAVYYGLHIHSEDNPLGLHSHIPGGAPTGGHSHGPQNRFGVHHHKGEGASPTQLDGKHAHEPGENMPSGPHEHVYPENFA